eukprot:5939543-Amphidinium_carterae.2
MSFQSKESAELEARAHKAHPSNTKKRENLTLNPHPSELPRAYLTAQSNLLLDFNPETRQPSIKPDFAYCGLDQYD